MRNRSSQISYCTLASPVGALTIVADAKAITHIVLPGEKNTLRIGRDWVKDTQVAPIAEAICQLREYFAKQRTVFNLLISPQGTVFQKRVWDELKKIPYGKTLSYGELARRVGNPRAARAVGLANRKNPISIVIPCHRVIGANGDLTGYAAGIKRKRLLLKLEGALEYPD